MKERVIELRRIGKTQVDAMIAVGKRKIEESSLAIQTRIMASALSDEAKAFLEEMPTPEQLMPPLKLGELETMLGQRFTSRYALDYEDDE